MTFSSKKMMVPSKGVRNSHRLRSTLVALCASAAPLPAMADDVAPPQMQPFGAPQMQQGQPAPWTLHSLKLTAEAPENGPSQKETIVFQPSIFRCEGGSQKLQEVQVVEFENKGFFCTEKSYRGFAMG